MSLSKDATFSDLLGDEFSDMNDLVAVHADSRHETALTRLFACVEEHSEQLVGRDAAKTNKKKKVVAKEVLCWHARIDWNSTDSTYNNFLVTGKCLGPLSNPAFKCDKKRIIGCLICPPKTDNLDADKTICMLIARTKFDVERASATHLKCPNHLFWLGVQLLYELEGYGKEYTDVKVQKMKTDVEARRRFFVGWAEKYEAVGLTKNADSCASIRFAKASKVLAALAV